MTDEFSARRIRVGDIVRNISVPLLFVEQTESFQGLWKVKNMREGGSTAIIVRLDEFGAETRQSMVRPVRCLELVEEQ
jgi:hypothetical protein